MSIQGHRVNRILRQSLDDTGTSAQVSATAPLSLGGVAPAPQRHSNPESPYDSIAALFPGQPDVTRTRMTNGTSGLGSASFDDG
jgi:hypothetical protein